MKIAIIGGDGRFDVLAQLLGERHAVLRDPAAEQLVDVDCIVTQNPVRNGMEMEQILCHMSPQAKLILMGSSRCSIPDAVDCIDLLEQPDFVEPNAVLTAEGAICAAMQATKGALWGSRCLVVGYGRIAKALTGMLTGLGAQVIVAARKPDARMAAKACGAESCGTDETSLGKAIALADYVFATPPAVLLTQPVLESVRPGVPVIDLASPPFCVDLAAAQRLGVKAWRESGLPGRYCPLTAAALIADCVERRLCGPLG